jgi:hypothetical protein
LSCKALVLSFRDVADEILDMLPIMTRHQITSN